MIDVSDKLPELIRQMDRVVASCEFIRDASDATLSDLQQQLFEIIHQSAVRLRKYSQDLFESVEAGTIDQATLIVCLLHDFTGSFAMISSAILLIKEVESDGLGDGLTENQQERIQIIQQIAEENLLYLGYLRDERVRLFRTNQDSPT